MSSTKRILCVVVLMAVVNGSLALLVRGNFFHSLLAAGVALLGAFIIIFGAMTWILSIVFSEPSGPRFAKRLLFVGIIASSLGSTIPLGNWVAIQDVAAAKQYCQDLIPRFEIYLQQHGNYPEQIELLGDVDSPPWLLTGRSCYVFDGKKYTLSYYDNVSLYGYEHVYDSQRKVWTTRD